MFDSKAVSLLPKQSYVHSIAAGCLPNSSLLQWVCVMQLRQQEERLAGLVDKMVQGYHSGFAKSIQNYSQILYLFADSKEQVI